MSEVVPPGASSVGAPAPPLAGDAPRNALRYVVSAREQQALYRYIVARNANKKKRSDEKATESSNEKPRRNPYESDDFNAASIRVSLRLFLASYSGLKLYEVLTTRLLSRGSPLPKTTQRFYQTPSFRLSLSLSTLLFLHRTLHRFLLRLRSLLASNDIRAAQFRRRNPQTSGALTSRLTPALGASTSSLALLIAPADQTRLTIAIYITSRALEFGYNALPANGLVKANKPAWLGSWCLVPPACAQLLHAFVFDRDCFPASFGDFIMKRSPEYVHQRPAAYPEALFFPSTTDIVDALARISQLKWPKFQSPILFPTASYSKHAETALANVASLIDPAHPAISNLSCAVLHPGDPSCTRTYLKYFLSAFPSAARLFALIYGAFVLLRYKAFVAAPGPAFQRLFARILQTSMFVTASIGGAWSSICLFQRVLPGHVMPSSRWYASGFVAGTAAWFERKGDRSNFLYCARLSTDSLWKVGKKHGWLRGVAGGDVLVFWVSMALLGAVYQRKPEAVEGPMIRKTLGLFRGEGWVDRVPKEEPKEKKEQ